MIIPSFLKGKSKADLAPSSILTLLFITLFQIIRFCFGVIFECQIAGSNPKNSANLDLKSFVKKISGNNTSA